MGEPFPYVLEGGARLIALEAIQKYHLCTPRNVLKSKKVLEEKGLVEFYGERVSLNDPIFEYWLRK